MKHKLLTCITINYITPLFLVHWLEFYQLMSYLQKNIIYEHCQAKSLRWLLLYAFKCLLGVITEVRLFLLLL